MKISSIICHQSLDYWCISLEIFILVSHFVGVSMRCILVLQPTNDTTSKVGLTTLIQFQTRLQWVPILLSNWSTTPLIVFLLTSMIELRSDQLDSIQTQLPRNLTWIKIQARQRVHWEIPTSISIGRCYSWYVIFVFCYVRQLYVELRASTVLKLSHSHYERDDNAMLLNP